MPEEVPTEKNPSEPMRVLQDEPRHEEQKPFKFFTPFEDQQRELIKRRLVEGWPFGRGVEQNFIGSGSGAVENYAHFVAVQVEEKKVYTFPTNRPNGQGWWSRG